MEIFNVKSNWTPLVMFVLTLIAISNTSFAGAAATLKEDEKQNIDLLQISDVNKLQKEFLMQNEWYDEELDESLLSDEDDNLNLIEMEKEVVANLKNTKTNSIDDGKLYRNSLDLFRNKAAGIDKKYKYVFDSISGMIYKHDTGKSISCSIEVKGQAVVASTSLCYSLSNHVQENIQVVCSPIHNACVVSNLETLLAQQKLPAEIDDVAATNPPMSTSRHHEEDLSSPSSSSSYFTILNEVYSESSGDSLTCLSNNHCDEAAIFLNKPLYCGLDGYCKVGAKDGDIYCELNMDCFEAGSYNMKCDYGANICVDKKKQLTEYQNDGSRDNIISHIIKKASFTQQLLLGVSLVLAMVSGFIFVYEWLKVGKNENSNDDDDEEEDYLYQTL